MARMIDPLLMILAAAAFMILVGAWLMLPHPKGDSDTPLVETPPEPIYHLAVDSMTHPNVSYKVEHDSYNVYSCTCPDYQHRHESRENYWCKHMTLVASKLIRE